MPREISIRTGARLHFGLLAYDPGAESRFGGAGLMIDSPGFQLIGRHAQRDCVFGLDSDCARATGFVSTYRANCPPDKQPRPCQIEIRSTIPAHAGLGSGTQLGMAVARLLAGMADDNAESATLAARVGRGARSAIGVHGFETGGLLIDGGKLGDVALGALAARVEFPLQWRFVLVTPPGQAGLSGNAEHDAFTRLPRMPQTTTDRLCRILLMELIPAVRAMNCDASGDALFEFGRTVGDCFSPVQGGTYANSQMACLVDELCSRGLRGLGQSSWGPTVFVLMPELDVAQELVAELSNDRRWCDCHFQIAAALNAGATVVRTPG